MKKRVFEVFDEMNVADTQNGTALVGLVPSLVEAKTAKGGGHVTMGVPREVLDKIMFTKNISVVLLVYDYAEYKRLEAIPAETMQAEAIALSFANYLDHWDIRKNPTEIDRWYGYGKKAGTLESHYKEFLVEYLNNPNPHNQG